MNKLSNILNEESWIDDVNINWSPKEGLFLEDDPKKIADYLIKNSKDKGQAMKRLVFYMNRAGENLKNKTVLNQVKKILQESLLLEMNANDLEAKVQKTVKNINDKQFEVYYAFGKNMWGLSTEISYIGKEIEEYSQIANVYIKEANIDTIDDVYDITIICEKF